MHETTFDVLARRASAAHDRRASLKALGAAAAGKAGKKARKMCQRQVGACKSEFDKACEGAEVCLSLATCCDFLRNCDAAGQIKCITDIL